MEATPEGNHTIIYDTNGTLGTKNIMTGYLKFMKFSFDAAEISQLSIYKTTETQIPASRNSQGTFEHSIALALCNKVIWRSMLCESLFLSNPTPNYSVTFPQQGTKSVMMERFGTKLE